MAGWEWFFVALLLTAVPGAAVAEEVMGTPAATYRYVVTHPLYGEIGSFIDSIKPQGTGAVVASELHVKVTALTVTLRRVEANRQEVWRDGRLAAYHSVTTIDGRVTTVEGHAQDGRFVVDGPTGHLIAPAHVFPSNPWTMGIVQSDTIVASKTGRLARVHFVEKPGEPITIDGHRIETRYFADHVNDARPELWFDRRGILVRAKSTDEGSRITLTLQHYPPQVSASAASPN